MVIVYVRFGIDGNKTVQTFISKFGLTVFYFFTVILIIQSILFLVFASVFNYVDHVLSKRHNQNS